MIVEVHVEDVSDFEIISILVGRLLACPITANATRNRPGGVGALKKTLEPVVWAAWHHGADGLVIVIDNDGATPLHDCSHAANQKARAEEGCNYCQLVTSLPALPDRPPLAQLKFAVGVAVQALESWLLFGADVAGRKREAQPEKLDRNVLKQRLYGACHSPRWQRLEVCKPIAERVDLTELSQACPSFSFFAENVRQLKA
jgi:hypothetical protein